MKEILISIQPKWCFEIASGRKTIEVRKNKPNTGGEPFKCYVYCTKSKWEHLVQMPDKSYRIYNEKDYGSYDKLLNFEDEGNGKVIGEFICDEILPIRIYYLNPDSHIALKEFPFTSLTDKQIIDYLGNGKQGYGWHISNLVIYDEPKDITSFKRKEKPLVCTSSKCEICPHWKYMRVNADEYDYDCDCNHLIENYTAITRAPQSWCYTNANFSKEK